MRKIPKYIQQSGVVGATIRHKWDDEDPDRFYPEDERLESKMARVCDRGLVALSASTAEWLAWRLDGGNDNLILLQEIEAVRAGIIDWKYLRPLTQSAKAPDWDRSQGPKLGPLCAAFYLLSAIVNVVKDGEPATPEAGSLSNLALHVMPNKEAFKAWRRSVITMLSNMYPEVEGVELGPPIPPEALDPDFNYQPNMAKELLSKYLSELDCKQNPFLASPEQMIGNGFKGKPYSL